MSKAHRSNLCGLCGDNNGDPGDDFRDKRGRVVVGGAERFVEAWRVRGVCQRRQGPVSSQLAASCRPGSPGAVRAEGLCAGFFHQELGASRVDVTPYIG